MKPEVDLSAAYRENANLQAQDRIGLALNHLQQATGLQADNPTGANNELRIARLHLRSALGLVEEITKGGRE